MRALLHPNYVDQATQTHRLVSFLAPSKKNQQSYSGQQHPISLKDPLILYRCSKDKKSKLRMGIMASSCIIGAQVIKVKYTHL